jgi:hypothetical protein
MTKPPDTFSGVRSESSLGRDQGREDASRAGAAVPRSPEPDHDLNSRLPEGAAGGFRAGEDGAEIGSRGFEGASLRDWRADVEERFLSSALGKAGLLSAKTIIDRDHDLTIVRQAKALGLSRSTVCTNPRPVSAEDL